VLLDDAAVLHRHLVPGEGHHARAEAHVLAVEGGAEKMFVDL
jgi:hypothetical protein